MDNGMSAGTTLPNNEGEKIFAFAEYAIKCACELRRGIKLEGFPVGRPVDLGLYVKPDVYHKRELKRFERLYQDFLADPPTEETLGKEYDALLETERKYFKEREQERIEYRRKHEKMLQEVMEWEPPTPEHLSLKEYMISKLQVKVNVKCGVYEQVAMARDEFIRIYITPDYLLREIEHHKREWEEEKVRYRGTLSWLSQLFESLGIEVKDFDGNEEGLS